MKPKKERNNFIVRELQKCEEHTTVEFRMVADKVEKKFGDKLTPNRVKFIWMRYLGNYDITKNVQIDWHLHPKS